MVTGRKYNIDIAISKPSCIIIENISLPSERLMTADIVVHVCKIRVITADAPPEKFAAPVKEKFYAGLSKILILENMQNSASMDILMLP